MTSSQPNLPFDAHRLARATDPQTSRAAAESAKDLRTRHHATILDVMLDGEDWNADEIAARCELDRVQVGRRLHELERHGYVEKTGNARPSASGRMANCYALAEQEAQR